jgi:hypothetical protein
LVERGRCGRQRRRKGGANVGLIST